MSKVQEFQERTLTIPDGLGLHARVATMMVRAMENYTCNVTLIKDDVEVNARSVLGLLLLAAAPGSRIVVRAEGPDSREAVEAITRIIEHDNRSEN